MQTLQVNNGFAQHIAFLVKLLKLDTTIQIKSQNTTFDFTAYKNAYSYAKNKLQEEATTYIELDLFEYYLASLTIVSPQQSEESDQEITGADLLETQNNFFLFLHTQDIIQSLHLFIKDEYASRNLIGWAITYFYERPPSPGEVNYTYNYCKWNDDWPGANIKPKHNESIDEDTIYIFPWLLILHFSQEGRSKLLHKQFISVFRTGRIALNKPALPVLFYGHFEEADQSSHSLILDCPYTDVFIHTWNKRHTRLLKRERMDATSLQAIYDPISITVEDIYMSNRQFSFADDFDLIFLRNDQEHDDATKYVNARLYSLKKAWELMKATNITYRGAIAFASECTCYVFDYFKIVSNITEPRWMRDPALWLPAGCRRCDIEAKWPHLCRTKVHGEHINNLSCRWFYAPTEIADRVCQLIDHTLILAQESVSINTANYMNYPHVKFGKFVYMQTNFETHPMRCFHEGRLFRDFAEDVFCITSSGILSEYVDMSINYTVQQTKSNIAPLPSNNPGSSNVIPPLKFKCKCWCGH